MVVNSPPTSGQTFMAMHSIEYLKVPPDAHAQNGRVERVHLTILNGVGTLLGTNWPTTVLLGRSCKLCGLHKLLVTVWHHQVNTRRLVCKGKQLSQNHLQSFGCQVFYRDHRFTNELGIRYKEAIVEGYVEGTTN